MFESAIRNVEHLIYEPTLSRTASWNIGALCVALMSMFLYLAILYLFDVWLPCLQIKSSIRRLVNLVESSSIRHHLRKFSNLETKFKISKRWVASETNICCSIFGKSNRASSFYIAMACLFWGWLAENRRLKSAVVKWFGRTVICPHRQPALSVMCVCITLKAIVTTASAHYASHAHSACCSHTIRFNDELNSFSYIPLQSVALDDFYCDSCSSWCKLLVWTIPSFLWSSASIAIISNLI